MRTPHEVIRRTGLLCLVLLSAPGALTGRASDIESGEDAVILEETLEVEIRSAAHGRVRHLQRTQILTPRGAEEYGGVSIGYTPWETIRYLRGSILSPDGKRAAVKKQSIFDGSDFESFQLYSDWKKRTMVFPGAVPGAVVEWSYEKEVRNLYFLPDGIDLQVDVPVRSRTLTVRAPASFPVRISVRGGQPEYTRQEQAGVVTHRWQVRDARALKRESDMPPIQDVVPRVSITPKELVWDERRIDASNWDGIARWDWDLAGDRIAPTPEVAKVARELTAGVREPVEQVRRLYEFVQGKVNYVAISLGIGGWQPHAAGDVLRHRYGDCKDKAGLLIALLRSVGLQGFPVLIRQRNIGLMDRDDPYPGPFNHVIAAVPAPGGYLFMDPTSEKTPFGDLPWVDQGVPVLVVKEDGRGDLVETPLFPPERNRRHRLVTAQISPTGDLEGNYIIDAWGQRRDDLTDFLDAKPTEREDAVEDMMAWLCPGAQLKGYEVTVPPRPDEPLRVTIRFAVPRFLVRAGKADVVSPHLVRFPGLTRMAAYPGRRHPVFFPYLFNETSEGRLRLPVGRTLKKVPADRTIEGPGLAAATRYELVREQGRDVLVIRRSATVSRREIPVADYPALRDFISALVEEESRAVTLEMAG